MRKLYLVPIIHSVADMGSLSAELEREGAAALGEARWERHREVVSGFWDAIAAFCRSLEASGLQVYQDGLAAGGAAGAEIVRRGAGAGSPNFIIIQELLSRGAVLVSTEDIALLRQEHERASMLSGSPSPREKAPAQGRRLSGRWLLAQRDSIIAQRINSTLERSGIIFIGAYHDIAPRLARDISAVPVKEPARVRDYQRSLSRAQPGHTEELARYLLSPVCLKN